MSLEFEEVIVNECFEHISLDEVKDALHHIIDFVSDSHIFKCHFKKKGVLRDLRFYTSEGTQPFALIVNKTSLLFYLRKAAVNSGSYKYTDLAESFPTLKENNSGEWTVKIFSLLDVEKLTELVLMKWRV